MSGTGAHAVAEDHAHAHPSEREYIKIAVILTIITALEVAIYYIDWVHEHNVLVPMLVIMSIVKFVIVVSYYMHLKFDHPLFRWMFISGIALSLAIIAALVTLEKTHMIDYVIGMIDG